MLAEIYIDALLVDEDLADQVWELWNIGLISDDLTAIAWMMISVGYHKIGQFVLVKTTITEFALASYR